MRSGDSGHGTSDSFFFAHNAVLIFPRCTYYSQCIAHYSHVLGVKDCHQMNYEYK